MNQFYGLEFAQQVFWVTAISSTLVFVVQTIMTFMGADATDGMGADFEGLEDSSGPFQLLSLRSLVNFGLGFGWTGLSLRYVIPQTPWLILAATAVGLAFVFGMIWMMAQ
ncbi:hypothetical protein GC167_09595 [bacterium]|nr:hypothetical protein [bacterium]